MAKAHGHLYGYELLDLLKKMNPEQLNECLIEFHAYMIPEKFLRENGGQETWENDTGEWFQFLGSTNSVT